MRDITATCCNYLILLLLEKEIPDTISNTATTYHCNKSVVPGMDPKGGNSFCTAHYNVTAEYSPSAKASHKRVMHAQSGQVGEWASKSEVKKPDTAQNSDYWANRGKAEPSGPNFC